MGKETGISWTSSTWNAIRGCSRVSEGCRNCYAESVAHRFSGPGLPYEGLVQLGPDGKSTGKWNGQIKFVDNHLFDPLKWKEPRRIFVNSMSDLFHPNVTDLMRDKIHAVMSLAPQHTFQVLTKRPEEAAAYYESFNGPKAEDRGFEFAEWAHFNLGEGASEKVADSRFWRGLPNLHMGVSGEDQETVNKRCWILLTEVPAAVRWLSLEPMLDEVSLSKGDLICKTWRKGATLGRYLDWVVVGGESGHNARRFEMAWAENIIRECRADDVPVFMKQLGSNPTLDGCRFETKDRHGADPEEWPSSFNVQQFPRSL